MDYNKHSNLLGLAFILMIGLYAGCAQTSPYQPSALTPISPTATVSQETTLPQTPSSSAQTPRSHTVSEIMVQGVSVPFEVCGESSTWRRPSEEEQRKTWWTFPRYSNTNTNTQDYVRWMWTHNFFVIYGDADLEFDILNLSGLWTLPAGIRDRCTELKNADAILKLDKAEVWILLNKIKSIKRLDDDFVVVVEPTSSGVQFVQFPRPRHAPSVLHFVNESGKEIEEINEWTSPYWPYPDLR